MLRYLIPGDLGIDCSSNSHQVKKHTQLILITVKVIKGNNKNNSQLCKGGYLHYLHSSKVNTVLNSQPQNKHISLVVVLYWGIDKIVHPIQRKS